jgi:hypothetical protein
MKKNFKKKLLFLLRAVNKNLHLWSMTICDFLALNETEQTEVVWSDIHIAERENCKYWILLYQVDSFYVELFFNKDLYEIEALRPFTCTDLLEPYLDKIDIGHLYKSAI